MGIFKNQYNNKESLLYINMKWRLPDVCAAIILFCNSLIGVDAALLEWSITLVPILMPAHTNVTINRTLKNNNNKKTRVSIFFFFFTKLHYSLIVVTYTKGQKHCPSIPARDTLERLGVSFGSPYNVNDPFDTLVNTAWVGPSCWSENNKYDDIRVTHTRRFSAQPVTDSPLPTHTFVWYTRWLTTVVLTQGVFVMDKREGLLLQSVCRYRRRRRISGLRNYVNGTAHHWRRADHLHLMGSNVGDDRQSGRGGTGQRWCATVESTEFAVVRVASRHASVPFRLEVSVDAYTCGYCNDMATKRGYKNRIVNK